MRCLTLFANVETKANLDNHNTREEYKDLVSIIDQTFSDSALKNLHWTLNMHELTEKLYGLRYEYGIRYDAVPL